MSTHKPTKVDEKHIETGDVEVTDLIPIMGICCIITSCYLECPNCLGVVSESTLCCLNSKVILCKPGREDECCKCCLMDCDIIPISICCKIRNQCFFFDIRSSLPCSEEIPCLCTVCFCTLCYKYKCSCKFLYMVKDME